ncbi:MAG: metallophosphoesterase [Acidobacteria bacterium]|nr:metallophosphoesterase [Acidobacteriota bacterium]
MKGHALFAISFALLLSTGVLGQATLIGRGSNWKYLDNGTNQGSSWTAPAFDDSLWTNGNAQLGYGDGDEVTTVGYGPDANNKYVTTYFRKTFNVADPTDYTGLTLNILRDDGAIVYLNGTEVFRTNMPAGSVTYQTLAPLGISGAEETTAFLQANFGTKPLTAGTNTIAVEIHQATLNSSDISFDLDLIGQTAASITRGPYLQMGTNSAMTVRWRTNVATDSRVQFGTVAGNLTQFASDATLTTEHEVRIAGLTANTKYFYSIGSTSAVLAGNDATHFFFTSPNAGQTNPYRFWILGDSGTADANAQAVRNSYLAFNGSNYTNLILMLGDNAYSNGTDAEYQSSVFDMYPTILRQTPLWSTIGNHDTSQDTNPPSGLPYFQMFTLPTAAEAGGIASGTEKYYSFNYGNIHFICLDSMTSSRSVGSAMLTWLQSDLSQNTQPWVVAFWHHPPYTKGSHNSDTEIELMEMRANVLPILESWGVDLVLAGHSHSYERSYLIDGHYGDSSTFSQSMKRNPGGGRENVDGSYKKSALSSNLPNEGAVYAVAGSSGKISSGTLNHPAMFVSLNNLGSMIIDVNNDRLDAKFLRENGTIADYFTIVKGGTPNQPDAPTGLTAFGASGSQINVTWADASNNEDGFKIERCKGVTCTSFSQVATVGAGVTTFANSGLTANTTYRYRVRAFNAGGDSAFSRIATGKTLKR